VQHKAVTWPLCSAENVVFPVFSSSGTGPTIEYIFPFLPRTYKFIDITVM